MRELPLHADNVIIFCDGSAWHVDGCGGWAFAAVADGRVVKERSGSAHDTTNNRMELMAVIESISWAMRFGLPRAHIVSDSRYCRTMLMGKPPKIDAPNLDLIETGRSLVSIVPTYIEWVKGHTGNEWNEYVDKLAGEARKQAMRSAILGEPLPAPLSTPKRRLFVPKRPKKGI